MASNRLFSLLYLLLNRGRMTAGELARELEVSVRTIYRDIDALSASGVPIYATQGKGGGVALMEHYTLDRAAFTESEQAQLLTALRSLPEMADTQEILNKLSGLFHSPGKDWLRVELSPWMQRSDGRDFDFFKNAILQRHILTFTYVGSYGTAAPRRALPVRLVFKSHAWYLQGWCLSKNAYRTFRLSRVLAPRDTGEEMAPPAPPPDIETGFGGVDATPITLRFSPAMAHRVYDEFDTQDITREQDGALLVRASFPIDSWVCGYLLSFGVGVEVLEPLSLKRQLALIGREIYLANAEPDTGCQLSPGILKPSSVKEECPMEHPHNSFCQSCGMPLTGQELGTEADGSPSPDYCKYCYQQGAFTSSMTMEEMIDFCAKPMVDANPGMTEEQAKEQMHRFFPLLLRWKKG